MKKIVIPVLSLLFIISLDSCKKDSDSDQQPEEEQGPRLLKITSTSSGNSASDVSFIEYDESGRITAITDSLDPSNRTTITYSGDEAFIKKVSQENGAYYSYAVRYKLNSNYQPVQRILVDSSNDMAHPAYPDFSIFRDTSKYEYDAAGLLVKVTGSSYDSGWYKNLSTVSFGSVRKTYSNNYINNDGKLMSVKINAIGDESDTWDGVTTKRTSTYDDSYSFEYNKNYANKVDVKNAWVLAEWEILYHIDYPLVKTYAYMPDKVTHAEKRTYSNSGNVYNYTTTFNLDLGYAAPSGYISSVTNNSVDNQNNQGWDKYVFTYDK